MLTVQMRLMPGWLLLFVAATSTVHADGNELPEKVSRAFLAAAEFELYSLDPHAVKKAADQFHGWNVLGKVLIKGTDAGKVREAIEKGRKESTGDVAGCFVPRHGLRITAEKATYDLVICFQCMSASIFEGDVKIGYFLTTSLPGPTLNEVLQGAKIPLPGK